MKRLLFTVAFALVATSAFAQTADRDVLVTPEGTVFTVETQIPSDSSTGAPMLTLTVQNGDDVSHLSVPDSTLSFGGALAYDPDSKTLFVLWIHMPNAMSSDLLLASYHEGTWSSTVSVTNEPYTFLYNLRLGITRRVSQLQQDGSYADAPALLLHAIWWEESATGESARYALLAVDKGALTSIETHSLEEFVAPGGEVYNAVDPSFNKEILRHPAIVSPPMQSTVDVIFGDASSNTIHGVTLHPIADVRIHIPVGIGGGRPNVAAPTSFSADWTGPISVIARGDHLAFANAGANALNYITYSSGTWSSVRSIAIGTKFPAEAALAALDRMLSTQ